MIKGEVKSFTFFVFIIKTNNMKKLLTLFLILTAFSCNPTKTVVEGTQTLGGTMLNLYEKVFTASQFDSICVADSLPTDLKMWHQSAFKDDETRKAIVEYLYIKELNNKEVIYRSEKLSNEEFKVTKRIIKQ